MKLLISSILIYLMLLSVATGNTRITVAKVDYDEIDDLLIEVVLTMEGNKKLGDRFTAKKKAAKVAMDKMQAAIMAGESVNPMAAATGMMHNDVDQKKVEQLCQKYLLEMIERKFEGKYEIIFKDDYRSSLLYTQVAIDDVTVIIKQELLKAIPKN